MFSTRSGRSFGNRGPRELREEQASAQRSQRPPAVTGSQRDKNSWSRAPIAAGQTGEHGAQMEPISTPVGEAAAPDQAQRFPCMLPKSCPSIGVWAPRRVLGGWPWTRRRDVAGKLRAQGVYSDRHS
jgi:hypothetical protein